MRPLYLFHGSGNLIKEKYLLPFKASDKSNSENSLTGVYASEFLEIAQGMALTTCKYTRSFADYSSRPFQVVFVRGNPKERYIYIYKVSSIGFNELPENSHQWVNLQKVKIIECKKYSSKNLNQLWRKATLSEKKWFYCNKHD